MKKWEEVALGVLGLGAVAGVAYLLLRPHAGATTPGSTASMTTPPPAAPPPVQSPFLWTAFKQPIYL